MEQITKLCALLVIEKLRTQWCPEENCIIVLMHNSCAKLSHCESSECSNEVSLPERSTGISNWISI